MGTGFSSESRALRAGFTRALFESSRARYRLASFGAPMCSGGRQRAYGGGGQRSAYSLDGPEASWRFASHVSPCWRVEHAGQPCSGHSGR
jgi:hypothetical protein